MVVLYLRCAKFDTFEVVDITELKFSDYLAVQFPPKVCM